MDQVQAKKLIAQGTGLVAQGRLVDALRAFEEAIAAHPENAEAFAHRADALTDLGQPDLSIASYDRAIELAPHRPEFHDYRGIAFARLGRLEEALASLDQALAIDPENLNAMNNRANVLKLMKRPQEALEQIDQVLSQMPEFAAAHNNRGNMLIELERYEEAIASFDHAIELSPDQTDVKTNRLTAVIRSGSTEEIATACLEILATEPDHVTALLTFAEILTNQGRTNEAIIYFMRVLRRQPDHIDALFELGLVLVTQRRFNDAIQCFQRLLTLDSKKVSAIINLGVALAKTGKVREAFVCYDRAIALEPELSTGYYNRGWLLWELREYERSLENIERALELNWKEPQALETCLNLTLQLARWEKFPAYLAELTQRIETQPDLVSPFPIATSIDDPALQKKCAATYATIFPVSEKPLSLAPSPRSERIRVGYFSADFYEHATLYLLLETLEAHDRDRFEFIGFSFGRTTNDVWQNRAQAAFDHFIDIQGMSDGEVVQLARGRDLDIAVDLKGYTAGSRCNLFANRVAPVQANYLGYPGTMGTEWMDYLIADRILIPEPNQEFYSEKIVYLPGSYQPNARIFEIPKRTTRADHGLPDNQFVYSCFNNAYKTTPEIFSVWMSVLSRNEKSVLWLWVDNETARQNLRREATRHGVASERLVFASRASRNDHLERIRLADLFLDTLPCNAHTTASDALRMGLPLLTRPGRSFASRVAASLLSALDLTELIAHDLEQYEDKAVSLAKDTAGMAALKAKLERQIAHSSLFDPVDAARKLETAFARMHERRQNGLSPDHIYL
ncbi:tetratricopeptide repeat protein [Sphingobium sp. AS12]|uniref:tetratricopeptide repeat protein n=1 Tax=Sphingobium sp. AS12 TaxID=2849495 RepID=UPI001C31207F|nr:tetratricopeptide repeat protein [Sphingobium sp. AS12]